MQYSQEGYVKLAGLMGNIRDIAIFRRFDQMNILSLLSLQAEIIELESSFFRASHLDNIGTDEDPNCKKYSKNFRLSKDNHSDQYARLKELRKLLLEYNQLALQLSQMSQIPSPPGSQLETLKGWLRGLEGGNCFLDGEETSTWQSDDASSYLCLNPELRDADSLTNMITYKLTNLYHLAIGDRRRYGKTFDKSGVRSYSSSRISSITNGILVIVASMMPVLTIFILNEIPSTNARIGVTAAMTAFFAFFMAIVSNGKKGEILAATATFAAVEVVFIGSSLDSN
ncbi:hypothetical protein DL767_004071 [Monosporascus sp. MG133]|nr:hypothetical protein DL767_004071 [Monosporascus sp. MG133]